MYQKLFDYMYNEYGLTLLESQMDEIILLSRNIQCKNTNLINKHISHYDIMGCFPTLKDRSLELDLIINSTKTNVINEYAYRAGFRYAYNWCKRQFKSSMNQNLLSKKALNNRA